MLYSVLHNAKVYRTESYTPKFLALYSLKCQWLQDDCGGLFLLSHWDM